MKTLNLFKNRDSWTPNYARVSAAAIWDVLCFAAMAVATAVVAWACIHATIAVVVFLWKIIAFTAILIYKNLFLILLVLSIIGYGAYVRHANRTGI